MKSVIVKISLVALIAAGASAVASAPARALPGIDFGVAAGAGPKANKVWCGPYGCGWGAGGSPYVGGGYGWRPHPRPWGYGYGWRPRPYYGGGWGPRPYYGGGWGGGWGW